MNMRKVTAAAAAIALAGIGAQAAAHEMFLRPDKAVQAPNSEQTVRLINGTFDKSENAISRDRMDDVSIVANGKVTKPPASNWSDDATTARLKYRTGEPEPT
ncbi:MAG: hypothetical protein HC872_04640 [Gammaproteobacteria bacterium]|nr:hypothetical protein [Gammaproteobacteria bacterium]